jgi:hypothetical protein
VPKPYVPPQLRQLKAFDTLTPVQLAKSSASAQAEMARAMEDYQDDLDAADDDYDEDEEEAHPLFGQLTSMSCGLAAVQMVMASKGIYMDASYVERLSQEYPGSYDPATGTAMTNMAKVLKEYVACSAPKPMAKGPVIARVEGANGHFVVIDSVTGDPPVHDGARGIRTEGTRVLSIRDPWPPGSGAKLSVSEQAFQQGGGALKTTALYIHLT